MESQTVSFGNFVTYKEGYQLPTRTLKEFMTELRNMEVREDDIFIVTFPKSGTHWMLEIVNLILADGHREKIPSCGRRVPIEISDVAIPSQAAMAAAGPFLRQMECAPSPRVLTTHATYECLPKDHFRKRCKTIYVYRNPKDVIVSLYNMIRKVREKEQGIPIPHSRLLFADFFKTMTSECHLYGGWFDHVTEYCRHRQDDNYFVVSYEEMTENLPKVVKEVANFIGKDVDNEALDRIVKASSLDTMRNSYQREQNDNVKRGNLVSDATVFFNKGKVGQWQDIFPDEQSQQFDKMFLEKIHDEDLLKAYGPQTQ